MTAAWPLLDVVARRHLDGGVVAGRRVFLDVPRDDAIEAARDVLASCGADVAAGRPAELVVRPWEVGAGDRWVDVPLLDPTGEAHGLLRAVLRLTNRRLPGAAVAVVGFGGVQRELAGAVRALGGRVIVVDDDPLHRLAAITAGHDVGDAAGATFVFGDAPSVAAGAVLAGPDPSAVGGVLDEPRPGMWRVRRAGGEVFVLDPARLASGRPRPWLDLTWTTRLVTLAHAVADPGATGLPDEVRRELAAAALRLRGAA